MGALVKDKLHSASPSLEVSLSIKEASSTGTCVVLVGPGNRSFMSVCAALDVLIYLLNSNIKDSQESEVRPFRALTLTALKVA